MKTLALVALVGAMLFGVIIVSRHHIVPVNERDSVAELAGEYVDGPCRLDLHKDLTYSFSWADGTTTGPYSIEADKEIALSVSGFSSKHSFPNEKTKYEFKTGSGIMPLYALRKVGGPLTLQVYDELHPVMLKRID